MSLKKCNECGNMVSTSARACPQCGAKVPKTKWWLWIPLGIVVLFIAAGVMLPEDPSRNKAVSFASTVKSMMKDPQSFDVVELRVSNLGAVCLTYRAKNSFNAYLQGKAVKAPDGNVQIDGISESEKHLWAAYCSNGGGRTYTY